MTDAAPLLEGAEQLRGVEAGYQASSPETIRAHAQFADLPVTDIIAVADTVVVRPDPTGRYRLTERPSPAAR